MTNENRVHVSVQTFRNWALDAVVVVSGLIAALSGVYFLFLPNGYMGGRNPYYSIVILFSRQTWSLIHMWSGVIMIVALIVHLSLHMRWVQNMTRKSLSAISGRGKLLSKGARKNILVNAAIALSFAICAVSGVYFLIVPTGGTQSISVSAWVPGIIVSRLTWDLIHTWSGVAMIVTALLHVMIHWRWITKVTGKVGRTATGTLSKNPRPLQDNG